MNLVENEGRTFQVLLAHKARVDAGLEALAKRCVRKGLTPLTWSWGKPVTEKELVPHPEYGWVVECYAKVTRIPCTLVGDTPKFAGWTFVATLQHLDGENIVRTLPGQELPVEYRTRGAQCDHCRAQRRRNDTYVVRHEDSRILQVGSTCIADFLGTDDAGKLAAAACALAEARSIVEGEDLGGGEVTFDRTVEDYLPRVAFLVRTQGWVSRKAQHEDCTGRVHATADVAWAAKAADLDVAAEDEELAKNAEAWAEGLTDEQVNAGSGDYLHNLRAGVRCGLVSHRTNGIVASVIIAYQKAVGIDRKKAARAARPASDYVGTPGKREVFTAVLDFVTGFETQYGYTTILKFITDAGAVLTWKASSTSLTREDVGKRYELKGTVKKHEEYKGERQTILSRCAVKELAAPAEEEPGAKAA